MQVPFLGYMIVIATTAAILIHISRKGVVAISYTDDIKV